jgi:hypothetical protein
LAIVVPVPSDDNLKDIFDGIERVRKGVRRRVNVKELIEFGRS